MSALTTAAAVFVAAVSPATAAWNARWNAHWNARFNREFNIRWRKHHPDPPPNRWVWPWSCIAHYESGGDPSTNTGNGFYGGLQFTLQTWAGYGGQGNPAAASIPAQEAVAARVLAGQGWGAWPNSSVACGL